MVHFAKGAEMFFWFMMYAACPALLLPGMLGVFGEEAEDAANEYAKGMAIFVVIAIVVAIIVGGVYLLLKALGLVA